MQDMGKLLVSGNGKDYLKTRISSTVINIVIAGAFVVIGFILANQFGYRTMGGALGQGVGGLFGVTVPQVRTVDFYIFMWGGIFIAVLIVVMDLVQRHFISKTEISVYETGIKGSAVGEKYGKKLEDTTKVSAFQVEYDRLTSVEVESKARLLVNASGRIYLIGVANPNEIAEVINSRLSQSKGK
ncbi:MAG: hypothetical protein FWC20_08260 [Oscillospiraceae bacterium]|nr:hypothetical protein [Oscillospiraceae bacterium]MCL2279379.1 hypothetical protein [Oscillospiraceae bacterium]